MFSASDMETTTNMMYIHCVTKKNRDAKLMAVTLSNRNRFLGRPFVKRFALCYRTVVLSVCPVSSLAPNRGQSSHFSAHVYCGQTAKWIMMTLGMEVGVGPGHIVLYGNGNPAPLLKKGTEPPNFRPIPIAVKWLDASRCHLVWR